MTRVYLYALLSGPPACEPGTGVCAEPLRVVAAAGLVALVGDVGAAPSPSLLALRSQDGVLRRLAAGVDGVLPVRFGTVMDDDAAVTEALGRRRSELARALDRVAGCVQMTLRVWGEAPAAVPAGSAAGGGPGTRYLAARRQAHEARHRVPELGALRGGLAELVREERIERHDRPPLLATVQHLVPRGATGRYVEAIDGGRPTLAPWRVSVSGPWPPYAFGEETV